MAIYQDLAIFLSLAVAQNLGPLGLEPGTQNPSCETTLSWNS